MTVTEASWAKDLLQRMGYPVTSNNMRSVLAWEYQEGGHFANDAKFNPLNTTMDHDKYKSINSVGVAAYPDYETGMKATIATLKLPAYSTVRHDLAHNTSPASTTAAIAASPWGTWHDGASREGALDRAKKYVHDHPVKSGPKPDHDKGGTPTKKVVLDLHELDRLSKVYRTASDEIVRHRKVVGDIAAAVEPARAALADKGLATSIQSLFNWLLEPGGGFDHDARLHDELSVHIGDIHRLAEEADADDNGTWTRKEASAFAAKHKGADTPALAAVTAALAHGTIVRRSAVAPTRAQKIDKMLDVAREQHANDGGSNHTKYGEWYGTDGVAWCAQFVSYVFAHSGNRLPSIDGTPGKGFQYCPDAINYAREHNQLHSRPKVGDIFLRKDGQHTGIVSKVHADGTFDTIEGNAGPQTDRVFHGTRNANDGIYYFWTAIR